jgi:hypothetical protein
MAGSFLAMIVEKTVGLCWCSNLSGWCGWHLVHNFPYGISIALNRWGSSDERAIDPPLRFADSDGHRFELYMAHKKIGQINRAAIQIVAIPTNYATTLYPTVIWIRSTVRNKNSLTMNGSPSYRRSVYPS